MMLDLTAEELLTTTRSVRRRLDYERPVARETLRRCVEIALQAPSGSNRVPLQFVIVTDPGYGLTSMPPVPAPTAVPEKSRPTATAQPTVAVRKLTEASSGRT